MWVKASSAQTCWQQIKEGACSTGPSGWSVQAHIRCPPNTGLLTPGPSLPVFKSSGLYRVPDWSGTLAVRVGPKLAPVPAWQWRRRLSGAESGKKGRKLNQMWLRGPLIRNGPVSITERAEEADCKHPRRCHFQLLLTGCLMIHTFNFCEHKVPFRPWLI